MAETGSVVALEGLPGSGSRNDVGAIDGRIAEKWFDMEKNWFAKRSEIVGLEREHYFCFSQVLAPLEVWWQVWCWPPLEVDHWEAWL